MTWVQILRIVREHKDKTVNILLNKSRKFFSYYKMRQNSTFLALAKIHSIGFLSFSLKTIISKY